MQFEYVEHIGRTDVRLFAVSVYRRLTHYHGDIELLTPVKGSVFIDIAHRRYEVRMGEFFIINRNEPHSLACTRAENMLLVLQFNPAFAREYCPEFAHIRFLQQHIVRAWMPRLHTELSRGLSEMIRCLSDADRKSGYQMQLVGLLNRLTAALMRYGIWEDRSGSDSGAETRARERLAAIIDYIRENYMHNISLSRLAEMQGLDMSYLSHLIREKLGVSFREYVNRLRLERALYLLTHTRLRITDICEECGYSDYRYLNKAIFNEFGLTPSQIANGALPELSAFGWHDRETPEDDADDQAFLNLSSVCELIEKSLREEA